MPTIGWLIIIGGSALAIGLIALQIFKAENQIIRGKVVAKYRLPPRMIGYGTGTPMLFPGSMFSPVIWPESPVLVLQDESGKTGQIIVKDEVWQLYKEGDEYP